MTHGHNLPAHAAIAVMTLLTQQRIMFTSTPTQGPGSGSYMDIAVDTAQAKLLDAAVIQARAATANISPTLGVDSAEQSSSFMNGTLSNAAPGVAVTLQIWPAVPQGVTAEFEISKFLHDSLLPLAAQGWRCDIIVGPDLDVPSAQEAA